MTLDAEVIVAGGGPVGLAAAIHARAAGLSVLVLEPRPAPVDKACGEGLMPSALRRLAALGVDPPGPALTGIRYLSPTARAEAGFRDGLGRGVRRTALHSGLHGRAAALGATWAAEPVRELAFDQSGVTVNGYRGRWLIGADGLHSRVRRLAGLETGAVPGPRRYGVRRHLGVAPWTSFVEVHWTPLGELYVTPVADDCVGLALLGPGRVGLAEALAHAPELAERLAGAAQLGPTRGAGPLRQRARSVRRGRVLLAGDAAGYVDALTGEGVAVGLATAEAAVAAIVRGSPGEYPARWRGLTRRYRWFTLSLVGLTRNPTVRAALVPAAGALPRTFGTLVNSVS